MYLNQLVFLSFNISQHLVAFSEGHLAPKTTNGAVTKCSISGTIVWAAVEKRVVEGG